MTNVDEMTAGREMDALVAERVMGGFIWEPPCIYYHSTDQAEYDKQLGWSGWCYTCNKSIAEVAPEPRRFSTDIAAAWLVVEHLRALGWHIELISTTLGYDAIVKRYAGETFVQAFAAWTETAPLSLCRAALRALEDV